jgi:hypothetical protein
MEKNKNDTYLFSDAISSGISRDREKIHFVPEYPFYVIKRNRLFFQEKEKKYKIRIRINKKQKREIK